MNGPYEVIAYAYRGNACAPYRALRRHSRATDSRRVLRTTMRRIFGDGTTLASGPVRTVLDRDGRDIYGPAGNEVIRGGSHFQVWHHGVILGYVSLYPGIETTTTEGTR